MSESEMLRMALMDYAKELSIVTESIHRQKYFFKNELKQENV